MRGNTFGRKFLSNEEFGQTVKQTYLAVKPK
jgi:hypothetical protein